MTSLRKLGLGALVPMLIWLGAPSPVSGQPSSAATQGDFSFIVYDQTADYNVATGIGELGAWAHIVENLASPGYPNHVQGFSMGLAHDALALTATGVLQGAALADANGGTGPYYWQPTILVEGVTIGCIISIAAPDGYVFDVATEVVRVGYETNADMLVGQTSPVITSLQWSDDLELSPWQVVQNVVVVDSYSRYPDFQDGTITLMPRSPFLRGDCNLDGSTSIADAVTLLVYLFPSTLPPPLLPCPDACDASDDGTLNLVDVINLLASLFGPGAVPLPEPTSSCGFDPTVQDGLSCDFYDAC